VNDEGHEEDHTGEDDDVRAERERVYNNEFPTECPIVIKDMRKVYPNGKLAVKSVSLAIDVSFSLLSAVISFRRDGDSNSEVKRFYLTDSSTPSRTTAFLDFLDPMEPERQP